MYEAGWIKSSPPLFFGGFMATEGKDHSTVEANKLHELQIFKKNAIALLERIHPIVKRQDYVEAKSVYDFIVANKS